MYSSSVTEFSKLAVANFVIFCNSTVYLQRYIACEYIYLLVISNKLEDIQLLVCGGALEEFLNSIESN